MLEPLKGVDWKILMAAGGGGIDPKLNIALAFRELAENAQKIGELNVSPDLLQHAAEVREEASSLPWAWRCRASPSSRSPTRLEGLRRRWGTLGQAKFRLKQAHVQEAGALR